MLVRFLALAALLLSMSAATAQVPTPPADRVKAVAPYVNQQTVFVGYVDLQKLDVDVLEKAVLDHAQTVIPPDGRASVQAQIRMATALVRQWRKALLDAGATEVYGVADAQTIQREPGFLVLPNLPKAQEAAKTLQLALGRSVVVTAADNAVLISSQRTAGELAAYESADRPELAEAMAASDAPVVLVATVPDEMKDQALRSMPANLPAQMGGGPAAPLVQGFQWALAELRLPPAEQLQLVVQMKDQATAASLENVVRRQWAHDGMDAAAQQLLTPKAQGQRLTLTLGKQQIAALGPAMQQARQRALQTASMSQVRQLLMGIQLYAQEHKSACPEKLEDLAKFFGPALPQLLTNPARPNQRPGYIYLKPSVPMSKINPESVMVYEAFDVWPAAGVAVGFADGHCELICDEAMFRKLLKPAEAKP